LKALSSVSAFIKTEYYPTYKPPRCINSRTDEAKVRFGPVVKTIEKIIYDTPFCLPHTPFIKHTPITERARTVRAIEKHGCGFMGTDYSRFESQFRTYLQEVVENRLFEHMLANLPDLRDQIIFANSGMNSMTYRCGVRMTIAGTRMSGDMWTSLGNGFTNFVLAWFLFDRLGADWDGYVEGDDGIFSASVYPTAEMFASLGMTIKIQRSDELADLSFCGLIVAGDTLMRDPDHFLMGFGWTHSFLDAGIRVMMELLRAKSMSALYETPDCPIVSHVAYAAYLFTAGYKPRFVADGYHTIPPVSFVPRLPRPSEHARSEFARLFGISAADQVRAEAAALCGDLGVVSHVVVAHPDAVDYASRYVACG